MAKHMKDGKIDKRAAALRDNLKRRKMKAKADKTDHKESKDKESNNGPAKTDT